MNYEDVSDRVSCFVIGICELIDKGDADRALEEIFSDANVEMLQLSCMELLSAIGNKMQDGHLFEEDNDTWLQCESMLQYVCKKCKAKEVLIGLLELTEGIQSDPAFHVFLSLLRISFIRLPEKRGKELCWALCAIYAHIKNHTIPPETQNMEEEEVAILENCDSLTQLDQCVVSCILFCQPFVSEVKTCKQNKDRQYQALILTSFLMKLIEYPLACFEIDQVRKTHYCFYRTVEELVTLLFESTSNTLTTVLDWQKRALLSLSSEYALSQTEERVHDGSILVLLYFLYCQKVCCNLLPCIYDPAFVFDEISYFVVNAVKTACVSTGVQTKMVRLLDDICGRLTKNVEKRWSCDRLSQQDSSELFLALIHVMSFCKNSSTRRKALPLFEKILQRYDAAAQCAVIRFVFQTVGAPSKISAVCSRFDWALTNCGIRGWLVDFYRNNLQREVISSNIIESDVCYRKQLPNLVVFFCQLDQQEKTDLLQYFDQIMATLNLLRTLLLWQNINKFVISERIVSLMQNEYFPTLQKALDLSLAHYKLELRKAKDNHKIAEKENCQADAQICLMGSALSNLELIQSILAVVIDLLR